MDKEIINNTEEIDNQNRNKKVKRLVNLQSIKMNNFKLCDELLEAKKQQHLLGHLSHKIPVSVVIASLGDLIVWQTIEFINSCDLVPDEILICVPKEVEISIHSRNFDNVNVV